MGLDPRDLPAEALTFLAERHLATLTTLRPDGSPHVVAVGFTWDAEARPGAGHHVRLLPQGTERRRLPRRPGPR